MNSLFQLESQDRFRNASEEVLNNLHCNESTTNFENNEITQAKDEMKQLISSNNFDLTKVKSELQNKEWDRERINWFVTLLDEKSSELLYSTLLYYNTSFGETIVDFDWRLKMVLGTSELKTLRYPLLQLLLTTNSSKGQTKKMFEFNKDMLKKLMDALEAILH